MDHFDVSTLPLDHLNAGATVLIKYGEAVLW